MEGTDLRSLSASLSASLSPRLSAVGAPGVSDEFATSGKRNVEKQVQDYSAYEASGFGPIDAGIAESAVSAYKALKKGCVPSTA